MTYNLRRDLDSDGRHRWSARRPLVLEAIRHAAPDILGTQEGLPHQIHDIDTALPTHTRISRARDQDNTDESCAIHISQSRYATLDDGTFWLSDTPDIPGSLSWGTTHPRIVTWARLRERDSGREITVANTHLDHGSREARERGARLIAQRLPGAIIMGDLNAAPGDATHTLLLQAGWDDGGASDPTYHAFTGRATTRIDHVLAPPTHRIRVHRVLAPLRDGVHGSDHHAVVADVDPS